MEGRINSVRQVSLRREWHEIRHPPNSPVQAEAPSMWEHTGKCAQLLGRRTELGQKR